MPHPKTSPSTGSRRPLDPYLNELIQERATWQTIRALADALIGVVGNEWRIGDGAGGAVFQTVYEAARRAGLSVGDTYSGPRDENDQ